VCKCECKDDNMSEFMRAFIDECMYVWMDGCIIAWTSTWVPVHGLMSVKVHG